MKSYPARSALNAASMNCCLIVAISSSVNARGCIYVSSNGKALGATGGSAVVLLRPAWASWIPAFAPAALTCCAIRCNPSICASDQIPRSPAEMRPSGVTALASKMTPPTPPIARVA